MSSLTTDSISEDDAGRLKLKFADGKLNLEFAEGRFKLFEASLEHMVLTRIVDENSLIDQRADAAQVQTHRTSYQT